MLQASVWLAEYRDAYDPSFLPGPVKWIAYNLLAPIGRALGYRAVHEYVEPPDGRVDSSD